MTAVQVKITTTEYSDPAFGWYELYADETNLSLGSVVSTAAFNEISFSNSFIHGNLSAGETWYYWVRAAYLDRISGAVSYGALVALGSITLAILPGDVSGPSVAVADDFATFNGTTGKVIKDSGLSRDTDGTLTANSDTKIPSQKAVKTYVDGKLAGLSWKQEVRAATTANGTLATAFENGDTVDGVVLATGNRILLKDQSAAAENGIYIVAASGAPARASDADSGLELVDAACLVSEGTTNADTAWVCTTNDPIVVGVTALAFAQFGAGLSYSADGVTLQLVGVTFSIKNSGVGTAQIVNSAVTLAKIANAAASSKLLGSGQTGTGNPYVEIDLGGGLNMSGTTLSATGGGVGVDLFNQSFIGGL